MVFLRDNVSLQKLKQQHKSADDDLVDDEHSALEFVITLGKNEGLDVQFVEKKTNKNKKNDNNDGEMEWWVTKCICRVENTGETIELKMEESATIAMLKMKLRTEMNKKAKKIYSSSSSSLTTSTTFTKRNDFTSASTASTMKGMNVRNGEKNVSGEQQQNANEPRRIVLGAGVPPVSLAGKNTKMTRTNVDSMKEDDFRGFDDDDDDDEYEDLERDMCRNNQQQQLEKNTTSNKKNENVFLRDLSEFAKELVEVVAPKPKDQPIHHDKMGESKSKSTSKINKNNINELETMGSWEKVDEWQAWGEIGQVQVKHRTTTTTTTTTPTAAIQTPNVTINVKKVGRGKMEPMKLNATKVSQSRKKACIRSTWN